MMRVYYDFEFLDTGRELFPISLGMVKETGEEYYTVFSNMPFHRVWDNIWLRENVVPQLPHDDFGFPDRDHSDVKPYEQIAEEVRAFLLDGKYPVTELWGYYSAFDHVLLSWLWGPMINMPKGIPYYTHDLKQLMDYFNISKKEPGFPAEPENEHHALEDARWNREVHKFLRELW